MKNINQHNVGHRIGFVRFKWLKCNYSLQALYTDAEEHGGKPFYIFNYFL